MRNCLILGSGRSGTSMTAGVLSKTGYFMGEKLYNVDEANPKGYFEDVEINSINEDLLAQVLPKRPSGILGEIFFRSRPTHGQRWLAEVPVGTKIPLPTDIETRIKAVTAHEPFCFKDPRFCYTLPAWRPFVRDALFVCVFRHPGDTAVSVLKECKREKYLHSLSMNYDKAIRIWDLMYIHVLNIHYLSGGEWIFAHYNQFIDGSALDGLGKKLGAHVDYSFVDPKLKRSTSTGIVPEKTLEIYKRLCDLAGYREK